MNSFDLILVFCFPTQNMCVIEGELENLMGEFCIKMKGNCLASHAVLYTNISARDLSVWFLTAQRGQFNSDKRFVFFHSPLGILSFPNISALFLKQLKCLMFIEIASIYSKFYQVFCLA